MAGIYSDMVKKKRVIKYLNKIERYIIEKLREDDRRNLSVNGISFVFENMKENINKM